MDYRRLNRFSSASRPTPPPRPSWQDGDIVFLKTSGAFSPQDHHDLVASGYIHEKATCHPVIILKAQSGRAIITPVTAFSSGPDNNFLPPWRQVYHRRKCIDDFRAFVGTKRPDSRHAYLELANPKMKMPKPQASWVYLEHFWTVPYSVLERFNKAPGLLQVSKACLSQMRRDIKRKHNDQLQDALDRLGVAPVVVAAPAPAHAPARAPAPTPTPAPALRIPPSAPLRAPAVPVAAKPSSQTAGRSLMSYSRVASGACGARVTRVAVAST